MSRPKKLLTRIYNVLEETEHSGIAQTLYSWFMFGVIIVSILPLLSRTERASFAPIEAVTVTIFIIDYILRWITAGCAKPELGWKAYLLYPVTTFAIIDLLSILPAFGLVNSAFKIARFTRLFRLARIFKLFKYSDNLFLLIKIIKREGRILIAVLIIAVFYIFISASVMFCLEPEEMFPTFFDALYWATSALTTISYGDVHPVTTIGKLISMLSAPFGIAIIALPSGVITAGLLKELGHKKGKKQQADDEDNDD